MPAALKIPLGTRFGKLVTISESFPTSRKKRAIRCVCDCGKESEVMVANLVSGNTKSCGCEKHLAMARAVTKHGGTRGGGSRLYTCWLNMRRRCSDERSRCYQNYGGRGISVCDAWQHDFAVFRDFALANGYTDALEIDRIDVNGNYEPGNVRFVPRAVSACNKRDSVKLTAFGETKTIAEWSRDMRCEVSRKSLIGRLQAGWDSEAAITRPRQDDSLQRIRLLEAEINRLRKKCGEPPWKPIPSRVQVGCQAA